MIDKQIELIKINEKLNPTNMLTKVITLDNFSTHYVKFRFCTYELISVFVVSYDGLLATV